MKNSTPVIETKSLSMKWGNKNILNNLNIHLNEGEKLAIVGPSGSGKSTILKILAGLILPTEGELKIFGEIQNYLRLDQINPPRCTTCISKPCFIGFSNY